MFAYTKYAAYINTRTLIEVIKAELKLKETKIQALAQLIDSLEEKLKGQAMRLDALNSKKN